MPITKAICPCIKCKVPNERRGAALICLYPCDAYYSWSKVRNA